MHYYSIMFCYDVLLFYDYLMETMKSPPAVIERAKLLRRRLIDGLEWIRVGDELRRDESS